jgi:coproporphyrinogen III oxidase-like Fe-S oxidoreductase
MTTAGIYVHWAFCPYVCPYCDFAKWAWDAGAGDRYVAALEAEIDAAPSGSEKRARMRANARTSTAAGYAFGVPPP